MIIEKTFEDKYSNSDVLYNYVNADQHELTVTITLHEYRDLIQGMTEAKIQKEKLDWLKQYQRANDAEAKVKDLEGQIKALKGLLGKEDEEAEE